MEKSLGIIGARLGAIGRAAAAALAASVAVSGQGTVQKASHRGRQALPTRAQWRRSGARKGGYPGQTEEQAAKALERAQAKRARRAINCTENARRCAAGYHPVLQVQGILSHFY